MAVNYVKGQILSGILERDGIDISIANANVGINTNSPAERLDVNGNILANNIFSNVTISAVGNVIGGNVVAINNISANTASISGNVVVGNLSTTGNVDSSNVNTTTVYSSSSITITAASGTITLNPSGNVLMSSKNINNLADPINNQDAATKSYVDVVAQGLDPKASVVYATTSSIFGSGYTYNNGASGVGATLTAASVGNLTIDGTVVSVGQRVLIKNEAGAYVDNTTQSAAFNGIYTVSTAGSPTAAYVLTRTADFDVGTEMASAFTFVENGSTNADTGWTCITNNPITVGTTEIIWTQFSGAGTYTANTAAGLVLNGTVFSAQVDNNTTAFDGGGNIIVKAGANLTTPNIGAATGISLSLTGNITSANVNTGNISLSGNVLSSLIVDSYIYSVGNITTASNVITQTGYVYAGGNITGGNLLTSGQVSATGNVIGSSLLGTVVSASGNITGANVNTGQLYNDTGLTISSGSGNINLSPSGNVVLNNTYINGLQLTPQQDSDAASKYYVDILVSTGLSFHPAVVAATTTTMAATTGGTVIYTQPNGVSNGVGAYLQTTGSFDLVDTANVQTVGTRILVKNEANAVWNGVYTWSNATNIVRSTDTDQYGPDSSEQLSLNDYFFVQSGNINEGSAWVVDAPRGVITFGSSNISFAQFSQSQIYEANTAAGLSLIGTTFSAKVDNNTTAFDGGGNISVKAGANLTTPNIGAATGTSLSLTGTMTSGNVETGGYVSAAGNITGGNVLTSGLISTTGDITSAANVNANNIMATTIVNAPSLTGTVVSATGNITGGNVLFGNGVVSGTGNIYGGNIISGNAVIGNIQVSGDVTVNSLTSNTYLSAGGNVIAGNVTTGGTISATGNIAGGNLVIVNNIDANTANITGNVTVGNTSTVGNVAAGNVLTDHLLYANGAPWDLQEPAGSNTEIQFNNNSQFGATANFTFDTAANLLTVNATANIANINVAGAAVVQGNVTGGNLLTNGLISASANVIGGNLITGGLATVTGNVTTSGQLISTKTGSATTGEGQLYLNGTTNNRIDFNTNGVAAPANTTRSAGTKVVLYPAVGPTTVDYAMGIDAGVLWSSLPGYDAGQFFKWYGATTEIASLSGTGAFSVTGSVTAASVVGGVITGTSLSVTGNVEGANILTSGVVSAAGNVTGANFNTAGLVTATGNVTGGNILTSGLISASATITGGNLATGGTASATGNITAGNILTGGLISAAGNITSGNLTIANTVIVATSADSTVTLQPTGTGLVTINTTTGLVIPVGNTAQRPSPGTTGTIRFNTESSRVEVYDGAEWDTIVAGVTNQTLNGDGTTTTFTLDRSTTTAAALIMLNGITQVPGQSYTMTPSPSTNLVFSEAPSTGDVIDIRFL